MAEEAAKTSQQEKVRRRRPARRAILEAARKILHRDGAAALTPEAVVAESGFGADIIYAYFCNSQELLLALAADELSIMSHSPDVTGSGDAVNGDAVARVAELQKVVESLISARPQGETAEGAKTGAAAPQDPVAVGQELDGIFKKIVSPDPANGEAADDALSRLERRIFLIERGLTEGPAQQGAQGQTSQGQAAQGQEAAAQPSDFSGEVAKRLERIEKRLTDSSNEFRAAFKATGRRLAILEAMPPAGPIVAGEIPEPANEPVVNAPPSRDAGAVPPAEDDSEAVAARKEQVEAAVSAARKAAREAAAPPANDAHDDGPAQSSGLRRIFAAMFGGRGRLDNRTLLMRVAPLPIAALGLVGLTWFLFDASAGPAPVNGPVQANGPVLSNGTVLANGTAMSTPAPILPPGTQIAVSGPVGQTAPLERVTMAANAGNTRAQTVLGLGYLNGDGVPADENQALLWLQRAAEKGDALAQHSLARLYARDDSASYDPALAKSWNEAAASQGNRMAMNDLAVAYAEGLGTAQDVAQSARWFTQAARLGYAVAQFNLAVLYERGAGVPQDLGQAYKWYAIAAAQGDSEARMRAEILAADMDPGALRVLQEQAVAFVPVPLMPAANYAPAISDWRG